MCKINCSGGCPDCAPEDHYKTCVEQYSGGAPNCICGDIEKQSLEHWSDDTTQEEVYRYFHLNDPDNLCA